LAELDKTLLDNITGFTDDMTAAGYELGGDTADDIVAGIVDGIRSGTFRVQNAISSMMALAQRAADDADDAHSPSRKYMAKGLRAAESYAMGVDGGKAKVQGSISSMLSEASVADYRAQAAQAAASISSLMGSFSSLPAFGQAASGGGITRNDLRSLAEDIVNGNAAVSGAMPNIYLRDEIKLGDTAIATITRTLYDLIKKEKKRRGDQQL
jgi:hypothetical protein